MRLVRERGAEDLDRVGHRQRVASRRALVQHLGGHAARPARADGSAAAPPRTTSTSSTAGTLCISTSSTGSRCQRELLDGRQLDGRGGPGRGRMAAVGRACAAAGSGERRESARTCAAAGPHLRLRQRQLTASLRHDRQQHARGEEAAGRRLHVVGRRARDSAPDPPRSSRACRWRRNSRSAGRPCRRSRRSAPAGRRSDASIWFGSARVSRGAGRRLLQLFDLLVDGLGSSRASCPAARSRSPRSVEASATLGGGDVLRHLQLVDEPLVEPRVLAARRARRRRRRARRRRARTPGGVCHAM